MNNDSQVLPTASPFGRYERCPASWQLEQEAKRIGQEAYKKSAAADSGDRKHGWLAGQPVELLPLELEDAQFLKERGDDQVTRIFGDAQTETLVEQRLWMELNGQPALSGRFDRVIWDGKIALIQDYKTGRSEPDHAEQNSQLKVLAVLFALNYRRVEEVIVQIVSRSHGVTEARYTMAQLAQAYNEIIATLRAINDPHAPFNPSPEACRFCPAALICRALKDTIMPVARVQYSEIPLDPDRAAKLLDEAAVIKGHIAEIEKFYFQRLSENPEFRIPGYALVPNAPRREIENVEMARQRLSEYLDEGELNTALDLKVGQVEKLFGKKLKLKGKELRSKFNTVMDGVLVLTTPFPSLKRVSGKSKLTKVAGNWS